MNVYPVRDLESTPIRLFKASDLNIKDDCAVLWELNDVSLLDTFVVQQDFFQPVMLSSQMGWAGRLSFFWIAYFRITFQRLVVYVVSIKILTLASV